MHIWRGVFKHSKHDQTALHAPTLYWLTVSCKGEGIERHAFNTFNVAALCLHAPTIGIVTNDNCQKLSLKEV